VTKSSNGYDTISDFKPSDDKFWFSVKDIEKATGDHHLKGGELDSDHFDTTNGHDHGHDYGHDHDHDHDHDYSFIYNTDSGVLSFDADGKGGDDAVALATLVGSPDNVTAHDFFLG